jgi:hypothetical protein
MELDGFMCRDSGDKTPVMEVGRWGKVVRNLEAFWVRLESVGEEHVTVTVDNQLVRNDELACGQILVLSKRCILTTVGKRRDRVCGPCDHHGKRGGLVCVSLIL